jgi:hypothetical protein
VLAESAAGVFGAEQAACAQDGHHVICEELKSTRQRRGHHVESIRGSGAEPVLDRVGHLCRRSGEGAMAAPAAEPRDQLPDGQVLPPSQGDDQGVAALRTLDLVLGRQVVRQAPVERKRRDRDP